MTHKEAVNWIINISADIGKSEHRELWHYEQALYEIREMLESAQQWIPVTERLPEIDMSYPHHEDYLVQYDSGDMDVASWSNVNWFWTDHITEPHWNCVQFAEVIAWMPLPKPWEGEE